MSGDDESVDRRTVGILLAGGAAEAIVLYIFLLNEERAKKFLRLSKEDRFWIRVAVGLPFSALLAVLWLLGGRLP